MKKTMLIFALVAVLLLAACSPAAELSATREVEKNGRIFTIDAENRTITQGNDVYAYQDDGSTFSVVYPNGASWYYAYEGAFQTSGWSNDYDSLRYVEGDVLMELILGDTGAKRSESVSGGLIFLSLLFWAMGLFALLAPNAAWFVNRGWWFRNAEPSDSAIIVTRISGAAMIILGIVVFIQAF